MGTVIVGIALLVVVSLIVRKMIKDKKQINLVKKFKML